MLTAIVYADSWTSNLPSHGTLYSDTITSKTDGSSVNIADTQGLFVTGDVTTLGKVGIGTTGPSYPLHVKNTDATLFVEYSGSPYTSTLRLGSMADDAATLSYNGANQQLFIDNLYASGLGGDMQFRSKRTGSSLVTNLFIKGGTGNVGIGTTNPYAPLHVDGNIRIGSFSGAANTRLAVRNIDATTGVTVANSQSIRMIQDGGVNTLTSLQFGWGNPNDEQVTSLIGALQTSQTTNGLSDLVFATKNAVSDSDVTERMRITNTGNVGIGTANPGAKLHVQGQVLQIQEGSVTGNAGAVLKLLGSSTQKNWQISNQMVSSSGQLEFIPSTAAGGSSFTTPTVIFDDDGNVGIGTTNPSEKLDVNNGNIIVGRTSSGAKQGLAILSNGGVARPTCDNSIQGAITYEQNLGANNGHFFGCRGAGGGSYAWVQLD